MASVCVLARFYLRVFINTGAETEMRESLFPPAVGQSLYCRQPKQQTHLVASRDSAFQKQRLLTR